jgi:hypothetical protein
LESTPTETNPKLRGKPKNPSRRWFMLALLSGAAAPLLPRSASAQTVYYDQYGNPVVQPSTTVVVAPTTAVVAPPVVAAPVYGAAGSMRRQSRRVARRTSRRVARRR